MGFYGINVNVGLYHCGYMIKETDNKLIYRPDGCGDYLFLYFPNGIYMTLNGEECLLKKNACIFFAPKDFQKFWGVPEFGNTYVHFTVPDEFMNHLGIPFSKPFYPANYEVFNQLVHEIQTEIYLTDAQSEELAILNLNKLLLFSKRYFTSAETVSDENGTIKFRLERLRLEMLTNCAYPWTTQELSARAAMSRSTFYEYYKMLFGNTPKSELLEARMAKAKLVLTNKAVTVREAAQECGFESLSHFIRYYKKYYGHSPRRNE